MAVTDAQEAALRAFLVNDIEEVNRLTRQLSEESIRGYQYLAAAALSVIAGWRFRKGYSNADVVRYIAEIRLARTADGSEFDLEPAVAENVLRYSLGQDFHKATGHPEWFRTVIALLDALTVSELSSEPVLDALLNEAREIADRWLANR